ncbi:MAG: hypothetical protein H0V17_24205 [Deltaproteobacteria bacterium]|nr:hypothetical protein [Deltaproteobacteria bacterium]
MALALSSRRSTLAGVTSAIAAMAVAVAVAGRSCGPGERGPEIAVRDFIHAAKAGDRETVFAMLSPSTRARLEVEAKRGTDFVGAAVRYTAKDMVSVGTFEGTQPADITLVEEQGDRAVVYVASPDGGARMDLVRVDGLWRIDVPQYGPITP